MAVLSINQADGEGYGVVVADQLDPIANVNFTATVELVDRNSATPELWHAPMLRWRIVDDSFYQLSVFPEGYRLSVFETGVETVINEDLFDRPGAVVVRVDHFNAALNVFIDGSLTISRDEDTLTDAGFIGFATFEAEVWFDSVSIVESVGVPVEEPETPPAIATTLGYLEGVWVDDPRGLLPTIQLFPPDESLGLGLLALQELAVGYPDVRSSEEAHTDSHGTSDYTRWYGSRAISASLKIRPKQGVTLPAIEDALAAYSNIGIRPNLRVKKVGVEERTLEGLTASAFDAPTGISTKGGVMTVAMGWKASDPFWKAPASMKVVDAQGDAAEGITFSVTFPIVFTATEGSLGAQNFAVTGNVETSPTLVVGDLEAWARDNEELAAKLFPDGDIPMVTGTTEDPAITHIAPDGTVSEMAFTALDLTPGQYMTINMRTHRAYLNNEDNAANSLRRKMSVRDWFSVYPGLNSIRYHPEAGNTLLVIYSPSFIK